MGSDFASNSSLVFNVIRKKPEFIRPSKPALESRPKVLLLSDIDDQDGLRFQVPVIQFYRHDDHSSSSNYLRQRDPVKIIKEAIARTLVFYYPFAGRLKEGPGRKLYVDCTDEGILFIEADADVTLEQFGQALQPPFPLLEELLYDVPDSRGVLNSPLLLIQVTRLKCGGFIFALRINHTMSDAAGMVQFMSAVAEIARGASSPFVPPVWQREILNARNPPRVTYEHHEYDDVPNTKGTLMGLDDMVERSFFFGPKEIFIL